MKKFLLATTALVATAGMSAAGPSISGEGRVGLVYNDDPNGLDSSFRLERRITIDVEGSGSTDGGVDFGGLIRVRSDEGDVTALSGSNVWIGSNTWRLTGGNASGAVATRVGLDGGEVGLTGNKYGNSLVNIGKNEELVTDFSSNGKGDEVIRLDFNVGDFAASLSTTDNVTELGGSATDGSNEIAVSYDFADWTIGAGFEDDAAGNDYMVVALDGSYGDFGVGIGYADAEEIGSKIRVYGSYNFGDTDVTAFLADADIDVNGSGAAIVDTTVGGIGFTHSLAGATLAGGVETAHDGNVHADFGIRFGF
jgi:outer membrane protein OmpU